MKKLLAGVCAAIALIAAVPAVVSATEPVTPRMVSGVIGTNTHTEGGASVTATCNGTTKTTTANDGGFYLIEFNSQNCPDGKTVTVTAKKGDKTGTAQATVNGSVTSVNIPINIPVVPVPEMGTYVAVGAVLTAAAVFFLVRRRKLEQYT